MINIKTLDAKWLDPECHDGCKSLKFKSQLATLTAQNQRFLGTIDSKKYKPMPWHTAKERDFLEGKIASVEDLTWLVKELIKERNCACETSFNTNEAYVKLDAENQRLRELVEKYESCLQNFMVSTAFVTEMRKGSEKAFAEPMRQREELRALSRLKKGEKS